MSKIDVKKIEAKKEELRKEFDKINKQEEVLKKGLKQISVRKIQLNSEYKALNDLVPDEKKEKK